MTDEEKLVLQRIYKGITGNILSIRKQIKTKRPFLAESSIAKMTRTLNAEISRQNVLAQAMDVIIDFPDPAKRPGKDNEFVQKIISKGSVPKSREGARRPAQAVKKSRRYIRRMR